MDSLTVTLPYLSSHLCIGYLDPASGSILWQVLLGGIATGAVALRLGWRHVAAYLAVPAGIQFMADHDWPRVQARCHELIRYARQKITALTKLNPVTPDAPTWFAQMASFPLPPCDGEALQRKLYDEFKVEVPILTWQGQQFIRLSVQGYNTQADIEALLEALSKVIRALECR